MGSSSPVVAAAIGTCVAKGLHVMAEKVEYMAASGPDLKVVGGVPNASQARNIALTSHVQDVLRCVGITCVGHTCRSRVTQMCMGHSYLGFGCDERLILRSGSSTYAGGVVGR